MKVLIINGPNLNLLGKREPSIYGNGAFEPFLQKLKDDEEFKYDIIDYFQSNHEGEIIDKLQNADNEFYNGIILNAGGYTHTSVAIRDAINAIDTPVIEIHISNIHAREEFRHNSLISPVCNGSIIGFGLEGYKLALTFFKDETNTN